MSLRTLRSQTRSSTTDINRSCGIAEKQSAMSLSTTNRLPLKDSSSKTCRASWADELRAKPEAHRPKVSFEDRLDDDLQRRLHDSVTTVGIDSGRLSSRPGSRMKTRRAGRASPVPAATFRTSHALYVGEFLVAAIPGSSPLPWPSPERAGSALPLPRTSAGTLTTPQASLDAADRSVASPVGLSRVGFDPGRFQSEPPTCYRASWQLPGPDFHRLATTSF